jgi:hypothetical protein
MVVTVRPTTPLAAQESTLVTALAPDDATVLYPAVIPDVSFSQGAADTNTGTNTNANTGTDRTDHGAMIVAATRVGTATEPENLGAKAESSTEGAASPLNWTLQTIPLRSVEEWFSTVMAVLCHSNGTITGTVHSGGDERGTSSSNASRDVIGSGSGDSGSDNRGGGGAANAGAASAGAARATGLLPATTTACFLVSRQQTVLAAYREEGLQANATIAWHANVTLEAAFNPLETDAIAPMCGGVRCSLCF